MTREAAALADIFVLMFILCLLNIGERSPWHGEPLRSADPGIRTTTVDPDAVVVRVSSRGYGVENAWLGTAEQVIDVLRHRDLQYVVLTGTPDADYRMYEELERSLQRSGLRYIRMAVDEQEGSR